MMMRRWRGFRAARVAGAGRLGRRVRVGFTLIELIVVLVVMTIAGAVVVPELVNFQNNRMQSSADLIMSLLSNARRLAIEHAETVTVMLDPLTGHFRVDSVSAVGAGFVAEDTLQLSAIDKLESDQPRLRYVFSPTGAALADSLVIRGSDSTRVLFVDPWSGIAYASPR